MIDLVRDYLPWLLSAVTIYMTVLAGNKTPWAWAVGLGNQALWLIWICATASWGFLPMNFALWIVYGRNHFKWNGGLPEWVRGLVGRARGLVLGAVPARNLRRQNSTSSVHVGNISAEHAQEVTDQEHEVRPPPPNKPIDWARAAMNVAGFLWRWKWAILVVILVVVIGGALRNPFALFGPSKADLRVANQDLKWERALAEAEAETQRLINERNAIIAQNAQREAVFRAQITLLSEQGRVEIERARPANETPIDPAVERAWRVSVERMCVYPRSDDAPGSDPCVR